MREVPEIAYRIHHGLSDSLKLNELQGESIGCESDFEKLP